VPLWNVSFGLALQFGNVDVSIVKLLYATSLGSAAHDYERIFQEPQLPSLNNLTISYDFLQLTGKCYKNLKFLERAEFIALTRGYIQVNFIVSVCQMKNA